MPNVHPSETVEPVDRPFSISHFVHTLRAYAPAIILSLAAIGVTYLIIALALYISAPTQRITAQKFRLDFDGAANGTYPNGTKFASNDIISTPILLGVFQANHLERFTTFPSFSRAVFVLESNLAYERLAADYQARLADPKLSPIDRDRLQREWDSKAASISKNEYSLNWLRTSETSNVPEPLVRKALLETLSTWARYAATEQHVLSYQLSVYSPDTINDSVAPGDPIIGVQVLRSKISRVLENLEGLRLLPGAELARSRDGMSLEEIRLRLEEIVRFRLEPLVGRASAAGVADKAATVRFLESQLAYDQRQLKSLQNSSDTIRQAMAVYSLDQRGVTAEGEAAVTASRESAQQTLRPAAPRPDNVMPQLSETFLDRLVQLASKSADLDFRQKLVADYRRNAASMIPVQQAVDYDQEVLEMIRKAPAGSPAAAAGVNNEIAVSQSEARQMLARMNEIYAAVSRGLNPSKELYTLTAPAVTRSEHGRSLSTLALYGVVLLAVSLPVIVLFCLLHARMREEEVEEEVTAREAVMA